MTSENRHQFRLGFVRMLPIVLGVMPFGIAYGVVAVHSGLSIAETLLMSLIVFAGASQFMAVGLFASGADPFTIILSTFLINVRHLVMGLSLSPYLSETKPFWQRVIAFSMVDESYLVSITHFREQDAEQGSPYFLFAAGLAMYVFWFAASAIGAFAGHAISDPLKWGIDFAMPATFITMLLPQVVSRRMLTVVVVAASAALAGYLYVPGKWYVMIAVLAGTVTGVLLESRDAAAEKAGEAA